MEGCFWKIFKIIQFQDNVPFLYTLKMAENQRFYDVFRGYRIGRSAGNGLMYTAISWETFWELKCQSTNQFIELQSNNEKNRRSHRRCS